jgi:uncharacterized protein involved in exopolysaccharide biosynthesis
MELIVRTLSPGPDCFSRPFQSLSLAEQEKSTLQERLNNAQREHANLSMDYDRLKREAIARSEQDKATINNAQADLKRFRLQFEEAT